MSTRTRLFASVLASALLLSACGAEDKTINGVTYTTYGIANEKDNRNPNIQYEISGWSIVWSVVFCETLIVPAYFILFDLYQPVGVRNAQLPPGVVSK